MKGRKRAWLWREGCSGGGESECWGDGEEVWSGSEQREEKGF